MTGVGASPWSLFRPINFAWAEYFWRAFLLARLYFDSYFLHFIPGFVHSGHFPTTSGQGDRILI